MRNNVFLLEHSCPQIKTLFDADTEIAVIGLNGGFAGSYQRGGVLGDVQSLLQEVVVGGLFVSEFAQEV